MGIKGLWTVFTPYSEKKSLHEIRGETVAVDLSGWVCDSQNVTEYYVQPKMYLRNLFFRTIYLLLADINPIFVLEGDAPELKRDVMAARNAIQFKGSAPRSENAVANKKPDVARKRFKNVLKECETLLKCMGVRCIKGSGEAEATCAQLNAQGLVDAVVSQDSDCFAYGARRVYRNFSVSHAAGGGAMAGSVDCYDADVMLQSNGFGRNKMIALALLCGCDYGVGACGSSITTSVSFLHTIPDNDIIPRLVSWVSDVDHYEEQARKLATPGVCDRCGHAGRTHGRNGCPVCVTHKGCTDNGHKARVAEIKRELSLRTRAMTCGMPFPEPKVMKEFLHNTQYMEKIDLDALKYPTPSLIQFVKLMTLKLGWEERYCVEKFLPLLTKWHLQDNVPCRTIKPIKINKKRHPKGIPSYEVVWGDIDGLYEALIPDNHLNEDQDMSVIWTTTERQDLIQKYYPKIAEEYEESIKKPVKEKKQRTKKNKDVDTEKPKRKYTKKVKAVADLIDNDVANLSGSLKNMNISSQENNVSNMNKELNTSKENVSVSVNKLKRKLKVKKGQKTLESFVEKKRRKSVRKSIQKQQRSINLSVRYDDLDDVLKLAHTKACEKDYSQYDKENELYIYEPYSNEVQLHHKLENKKQNPKESNTVSYDCLIIDHESPKKIESKPNKHLLSASMLGTTINDTNDTDLSEIIDKIVTKAPTTTTARIDNNLYKLVFDKYSTPKKDNNRKSILKELHNYCSTPNESPVRKRFQLKQSSKCAKVSNNSAVSVSTSKVNTSYFFEKVTEDRDVFEISMEQIHKSGVMSLDCDTTIEYDYSLPDVCL